MRIMTCVTGDMGEENSAVHRNERTVDRKALGRAIYLHDH